MMKLCLGTVQFGMKYGINNTAGQPLEKDVFQMLDTAIGNGINVIDTAMAYGTAENIIGKYLQSRSNISDLKIISKLCPNILVDDNRDAYTILRKECEMSLKRLTINKLNGYLLHTPEYINRDDVLLALCKLKEEGLVENIGVSVYDIEDGFTAIKTGIIDYIQLPYSILDQRALKQSFFSEAHNAGITIFTRSAFLQGLFFMEKEKYPDHLLNARPYINLFEDLLNKYEVDKVAALLHFVTHEKEIDYLVFGVDNNTQLLEDIYKFNNIKIPLPFIQEAKQIFQKIDKGIILPSLWSNGKRVNR